MMDDWLKVEDELRKEFLSKDRIVLSQDSAVHRMEPKELLKVMLFLAGLSLGTLHLRVYHTCEEHPLYTLPFQWPPVLSEVCLECGESLNKSELSFDVEFVRR
jgi:hypothetical protein